MPGHGRSLADRPRFCLASIGGDTWGCSSFKMPQLIERDRSNGKTEAGPGPGNLPLWSDQSSSDHCLMLIIKHRYVSPIE